MSISSEIMVYEFDYENHEGKDTHRLVIPIEGTFRYGVKHPYYKYNDFIFDAFDLDKQEERTFAVSKLRNIEVCRVGAREDGLYDSDTKQRVSGKIFKGFMDYIRTKQGAIDE